MLSASILVRRYLGYDSLHYICKVHGLCTNSVEYTKLMNCQKVALVCLANFFVAILQRLEHLGFLLLYIPNKHNSFIGSALIEMSGASEITFRVYNKYVSTVDGYKNVLHAGSFVSFGWCFFFNLLSHYCFYQVR